MNRILLTVLAVFVSIACGNSEDDAGITINDKDSGYRGIWYMNQPSGDEYVYKYSGGLGTYCAKHKPFAVYCPQVDKTFFCYGGEKRRGARWGKRERSVVGGAFIKKKDV